MIDFTKPVQTKNGLPVRIYATDVDNEYPVHGAMYEDGRWIQLSWTSAGNYYGDDADDANDLDLVNVKIKQSGWTNVWRYDSNRLACGYIYKTKEEARQAQPSAIDVIFIEWEEQP